MTNFIKKHLLAVTFLLICFSSVVKAQDGSFSQNYASPLYLSPSFTGLTDGARFSLAYRDQYPALSSVYRTLSFSADMYSPRFNSGIGILYYGDNQGDGKIIDQNLGISYAYEIYLNEYTMLRPGLQFKFAQRAVNADDAYSSGYTSSTGTASTLGNQTFNNFDAAASIMLYSSLYWAGVTVDHLVKSDIGVDDIVTDRGMKVTAFAGYKWVYDRGNRIKPDKTLTFAANYRNQSGFNQIDVGAYWNYMPIELGLWYRGIPASNELGYNSDAVIAILGLYFGNVRVGYSYDITISDLAGTGGGAHELSLTFTIPSEHRSRLSRRAVPCTQPTYGLTPTSAGNTRSNRFF